MAAAVHSPRQSERQLAAQRGTFVLLQATAAATGAPKKSRINSFIDYSSAAPPRRRSLKGPRWPRLALALHYHGSGENPLSTTSPTKVASLPFCQREYFAGAFFRKGRREKSTLWCDRLPRDWAVHAKMCHALIGTDSPSPSSPWTRASHYHTVRNSSLTQHGQRQQSFHVKVTSIITLN